MALWARDDLAPAARQGRLGFDGFQQRYIAGGQNGFALVHIAGVAGVTLVGNDRLDPRPWRNSPTGYQEAQRQYDEDTADLELGLAAQRHGFTTTGEAGIRGYLPGHPLERYIAEKHAEREDDGAGAIVGHTLARVRYNTLRTAQARDELLSLLCQ